MLVTITPWSSIPGPAQLFGQSHGLGHVLDFEQAINGKLVGRLSGDPVLILPRSTGGRILAQPVVGL
jgi:hypothetical protein